MESLLTGSAISASLVYLPPSIVVNRHPLCAQGNRNMTAIIPSKRCLVAVVTFSAFAAGAAAAFAPPPSGQRGVAPPFARSTASPLPSQALSAEPPVAGSPSSSREVLSGIKATEDWELDCYSRPVMVGGKKLWEVLLTDSSGSFRVCETLASNKVNSRELRRVVEEAIEVADVKPSTVRFLRGAMFGCF